MKVLILAAGYAVRLGELTKDTPKPLLPINKKPIIDRILEKVFAVKVASIDSVIIVTNAKFFDKFREWLGGSKYRDRISLVNDGTTSNETRLGAVRDVEFAINERSIDSDLLIVAGDNLFDMDLDRFLKFAFAKKENIALALYDVKDLDAAKRYGVIGLDKDNRIADFEEKPERPKSTLVSTGIYFFPKNKLALISRYVRMQGKKLDAPGHYISWVSKTDSVYGFRFSEDWYDIGSIESFKKADNDYRSKEKGKM